LTYPFLNAIPVVIDFVCFDLSKKNSDTRCACPTDQYNDLSFILRFFPFQAKQKKQKNKKSKIDK